MMLNESDDDEHVAKKKGFKALLRKMKPNANRKSSGRTDQHVPSPRPDEEISDLGTPLAPPPPIPYLVARGDKSHGRDRSESVSSLQTDVSTAAAGGQKRISGSLPLGLRSVSAPQAGSSSGSQSVSPTSSRLNSSAPRRESYVSMQGRDRRGSTTINEVGVRTDRHGTTMEMLSNGRFLASPEPAPMNFDEPSPMPRGAANAVPAHVSPHVATYPPPTSRPNNKTTSSLSASTFIETPPAVPASAPFFDPQNRNDDVVQSASGNLSPNRYKNLPPLPAPGQEAPYSASPESFAAAFPDQPDFSLAAARYDRSPRKTGRIFAAPSANFSSAQRSIDKYPFQPSRTSFDPVGDRPIRRPGEITPRLAQSLYVQPSVAGSTGSFGRFVGVAAKRQESGTVIDLSDGKSVRGKKGFKGFFGRTGKVA